MEIPTDTRQRPPFEDGSVGDDESTALAGASPELLREIVRLAPIGIGIVAMDGTAVLTNDALRDMLGYSEDEFATLPFEMFTHPDDIEANDVLFAEMVAGERDRFELDKRFFHRDGHVVWGRLLSSLIRDEEGRPALIIGMLQDVTEEKRLAEELRIAEETYRRLVEQVPAVVFTADVDVRAPWLYVSPRVEELLGFPVEDWTSVRGLWLRQLDLRDRAQTLARIDALLRESSPEPVTISFRMLRADGRTVWIRDRFTLAVEPDGRRVLHGVLVDVTREMELEHELEYQALHDPLTGLANRRLFHDRVADRMARRPPTTGAVVFLDLDDFKVANDSLGHAGGDRLLEEVARRVGSCLRPADTAGRLGGDEFAVLIDQVPDRDAAARVAERIVAALAEPFELDGHLLRTSGSLGLAMLADAETTDDVLRAADIAMYHAKSSGKSRLAVFEPWMLDAMLARLGEAEDAVRRQTPPR